MVPSFIIFRRCVTRIGRSEWSTRTVSPTMLLTGLLISAIVLALQLIFFYICPPHIRSAIFSDCTGASFPRLIYINS
ncbi:hypothetical protein LINPERHAP1_LOCUS27829 [Linum perenne]